MGTVRSLPSLVPLGGIAALVCGLALVAPTADADPSTTPSAEAGHRPGLVDGTAGLPQTSDGIAGELVAARPPLLRGILPRASSVRTSWQVVPGVKATVWDENDARGPVRSYLLAIDWKATGITIDYADDGAVKRTATVKQILARDKAVAGVNGDFYDIGDTGAPLGIGRDRQRGLLHGRLSGWNSTFFIGRDGRPDIDVLQSTTTIKQRPDLQISTINAASVVANGIGLYTPRWGTSSGYKITDGQAKRVRRVVVRNGRVVLNSTKLQKRNTPLLGQMLVGRDAGARALATLKVGTKVTLHSHLQGSPRMAITGSKFLVHEGVIGVVDDTELHPRTAIGIDHDTHEILLLVVDGRQRFSRGSTMVELAQTMIDLGADEAINLDGGGSSTMVAKRPDGSTGVINSPSDGYERAVANAVEVTYRR